MFSFIEQSSNILAVFAKLGAWKSSKIIFLKLVTLNISSIVINLGALIFLKTMFFSPHNGQLTLNNFSIDINSGKNIFSKLKSVKLLQPLRNPSKLFTLETVIFSKMPSNLSVLNFLQPQNIYSMDSKFGA